MSQPTTLPVTGSTTNNVAAGALVAGLLIVALGVAVLMIVPMRRRIAANHPERE